jgi:hypothetical protein
VKYQATPQCETGVAKWTVDYGQVEWRTAVWTELEIEGLEKPVPIVQRADMAIEWAKTLDTQRGFETCRAYTCRKANELASAHEFGGTGFIRLSAIDNPSPRFVSRTPTSGMFDTAPRPTGAVPGVGPREIR